MRLDRWLWAVRVYKSRTLAAEAIKGGQVKVEGERCKPAHVPKPGEIVIARVGIRTRTVRYLAEPPSRIGPKLVNEFAEDLTPPEEYAKRPEPILIPYAYRPKGAGRPTKRDRRVIKDLEEDGG